MPEIKLSAKQKEVVKMMQDMYSLFRMPSIEEYHIHLKSNHLRVRPDVVNSLLEAGIIERKKGTKIYIYYTLTPLGKSIII